jgi:hypothetical protein
MSFIAFDQAWRRTGGASTRVGTSRFRIAEASKGRMPQVEPDNIAISGKIPFVNANPFIAALFLRRK